MVPALPPELVGKILEHAVDGTYEVPDQQFDLRSIDAVIRHLLLVASLVSSNWRPLAQDLLLRRAAVTHKNYEDFLSRIAERGEPFTESIRFLRVIGEGSVHLKAGDDVAQSVVRTTSVLDASLARLPCVDTLQLVELFAHRGSWLIKDTRGRQIILVDSGFLRDAADGSNSEHLTLNYLALTSFSSADDRMKPMGMTILSCETKTTIKALGFGDLGMGIQHFIGVLFGRAGAFADTKTLHISFHLLSSYITSAVPSPWPHFPSLEHLSALFTILFDLSDDRCLAPPYPLPPSLRRLRLHPPYPNEARPPTSSSAGPQIAGRSFADATAILLATVKDLPHLEELAVECALHRSQQLKRECETSGITLRCGTAWV